MNLKLHFFAALFFHFCLLTKMKAQILSTPAYKIENFKLNEPALNERIKQLKYGKAEKIKQGLNLNYSLMKSGLSPIAELIGRNTDFDIYKLPLDKMLCLVPNESYFQNMNAIKERFSKTKELDSKDNMPNLFKKQELMP